MFKTSTLFILLFSFSFLIGQDSTQFLLKFGKISSLGLYIAPEISYSSYKGAFTPVGGGSVRLMINQKWSLGAGGSMILKHSFSPAAVSPEYLRVFNAHSIIEYTPRPSAAWHLSFPLTIGASIAHIDSTDDFYGFDHDRGGRNGSFRNSTKFLTVQPAIQLEGNLIKYAKLYIGVGYRLGIKIDEPTAGSDLSVNGLNLYTGVKMGLFNFSLKRKNENLNPIE